MSMQLDEDITDPAVMVTFYKRLYPFKSIFTWLNQQHPPSRLFTHREFAFTLMGDVYIRYNSFANAEELKKQVIRLNPSRFEIGAVYNARPRDKKTLRPGALKPLQRELVFDIDMTDYDEIRTCCSGKGICKNCWGFIAVAVKILDNALRDQFGFRHLLWVYSGRRGIHCWISDPAAMALTDEQRKSIMGWLELIKGGTNMTKKVNVKRNPYLHPSLRSALQIARAEFQELVLRHQDCFKEGSKQVDVLLELLGKDVESEMRDKWKKTPRGSYEKWQDLLNKASKYNEKDETWGNAPIHQALEDIILQYTYPRIDAEVSKHRNHLLKAPFCVHPATGRVCVPVDPAHIDKFDPESVPTVGQLLHELDEHSAGKDRNGNEENGSQYHSDWEYTSLKSYVDMLNAHVRGVLEETRRIKREERDPPPDLTF